MRIEERLKIDEKHRHEEKRAQQHLMKLEVHHKTVKLDHKPGKDAAGEAIRKHDPTTSYLSTYMPKTNPVSS